MLAELMVDDISDGPSSSSADEKNESEDMDQVWLIPSSGFCVLKDTHETEVGYSICWFYLYSL